MKVDFTWLVVRERDLKPEGDRLKKRRREMCQIVICSSVVDLNNGGLYKAKRSSHLGIILSSSPSL